MHRPISLTVAIEIYPASKHVSGRLVFFADIAGSDPEAYLKEFRIAVGEPGNGTPLESDYAREIVANAEIAVLKLRLFEAAFLFSFLAFILGSIVTMAAAIVPLLRT